MSFSNRPLDGLYINGQWSAGDEHLRVINPATEALLTTVNGGDERAVDSGRERGNQGLRRLVANQRRRARRDPAQRLRRAYRPVAKS